MLGIGGGAKSAANANVDAACFHHAGNAFAANTESFTSQCGVDARTPVRLTAGCVNDSYARQYLLIALLTFGRFAVSPRVVSGLRHVEKATHHRYAKFVPITMDAVKSQRDSFAKKAVAFFRKSRSSVTRFSSRCNRRSSSSADLSFPFPGNEVTPSFAKARLQRYNCSTLRPRSAATSAIDRVPSLLRRIASILYSRVYDARFAR